MSCWEDISGEVQTKFWRGFGWSFDVSSRELKNLWAENLITKKKCDGDEIDLNQRYEASQRH